MKKFFLIIISLIFITAANATSPLIPKGKRVFNPQLFNIGYNNLSFKQKGESESMKLNRIGVSFSGGYAIRDNIVVNAILGLQHLKVEEAKASLLSIGAGARYYLPINFFAGVGLNYTRGSVNVGDFSIGGFGDEYDAAPATRSGSSSKESQSVDFLDLRAEVGYAWFFTDNIAFEPSVSYGIKVLGGKIGDTGHTLNYSRFGVGVGISIFF